MISKTKIKELASYRLQNRCEEDGLFVVEGPKIASEALAAGAAIRCICATEAWFRTMKDKCPITESEQYEVSESELERLSCMRAPNQVWMLVERNSWNFSPTEQDYASKLILALDRIQDPGNMGTILRSADWFGVRHVVCSMDTVSHYNSKVVQATMGAIFRTKVEYTRLSDWLENCGLPVYGATLGGQPVDDVKKFDNSAVLLIGNESRGISNEAMQHVTHPITIPNRGGTAESLNAAVAAAILMDKLA